MPCSLASRVILIAVCFLQYASCQSWSLQSRPASTWDGQRIAVLTGFGDYYAQTENGHTRRVRPDGLSVNIVAVVQSVQGDRVWIEANGKGSAPVGWVNKNEALSLEDAIPYFTAKIARAPHDWDSFLRRAEAEHALNQRDAAISDYTKAIKLHGREPFLFLRRGREYRILKDCPHAASDFEQAARRRPDWAEAYNMAAGVYTDCPDASHRNMAKAISLINHATSLSPNPTYLTVLALAYFQSGELEKAVTTQRQAVESPSFPPGYRDDAIRQLHKYEQAFAEKK